MSIYSSGADDPTLSPPRLTSKNKRRARTEPNATCENDRGDSRPTTSRSGKSSERREERATTSRSEKSSERREERAKKSRSEEERPTTSRSAQRRFVPNESLDEPTAVLVAAPTDHDATEHVANRIGGCFACRYTQKKNEALDRAGTWNSDDINDAYTDLQNLISTHFGKGVSNKELVDMIYEFYEREIRTVVDYGEWTKECIFQHLLYHTNDEDVQMQECNAIIYAQIQALRQKTWIENTQEGSLEPHHKNIFLLDRLVKSLGDAIGRKKARLNK